jgi:hypothetical protein
MAAPSLPPSSRHDSYATSPSPPPPTQSPDQTRAINTHTKLHGVFAPNTPTTLPAASQQHHGRLRLLQPQPQCGPPRPGYSATKGDEHRNNHCGMSLQRRCGNCSRYPSYQRSYSSRQGRLVPVMDTAIAMHLGLTYTVELRETPLHFPSHMVRWCRYRRRH